MKNNIVGNKLNAMLDNAGLIVDETSKGLTHNVDSLAEGLTNKVDNVLKKELNGKIQTTGHLVLDQVSQIIENGMGEFSAKAQKNVDKIIEKSSIPDALKEQLIKDVNKGIVKASSILKDKAEDLEQVVEIMINNKLPLIEEKLAEFIKKVITGMKNFAEKAIETCESKIHSIGTKIKNVINHKDEADVDALDVVSIAIAYDNAYEVDLSGDISFSTYEF